MAKRSHSTAPSRSGETRQTARAKALIPKNVTDLRHPDAKRLNNPRGGDADYDRLERKQKKYAYDPHLDPTLQWAGKIERAATNVDTVSLHIHQYISALDIVRTAQRENVQGNLWPGQRSIDFYKHDVDWTNRMILGDSLVVMNSLLEREQLAGKVQCIYVDPPYGVKFNSNFQPFISKRDVKDGDDASLTREPEQIQAYRDTWELGVHSYLTYIRDRLAIARELLTESGSIFVQISDENIHHVREVMDELFGAQNFIALITVKKTAGLGTDRLAAVADYLLWYARDKERAKIRTLYVDKDLRDDPDYVWLRGPQGEVKRMSVEDRGEKPPEGWRLFRHQIFLAAGRTESCIYPLEFEGETFLPTAGRSWSTNKDGAARLKRCGRLIKRGSTVNYVRHFDDFPINPITNIWDDAVSSSAMDKLYVVQTNTRVVQRCLLMATDPGDLVLDPTCGSGTTAYVAEQWGRRWITCDTSRVAIALARQRVLGARFPYYRLRSTRVKDGFAYTTVPHVTLRSIAQNPRLDACKTSEEREQVIRRSAEQETLYDRPEEDSARVRVSGPFTVEAIPVATFEHTTGSSDEAPPPSRNGNGRVSNPPADFLMMMIDLVKKTGVRFPNRQRLSIPTLRPIKGPHEYLHAEGESDMDGDPRRIAVSFGSQHAPVTPFQVRDAIDKSRGYDIVLFIGFGCDPEAKRMMDAVRGREVQFVHAAPDILVNDLLKTTRTTSLFTVFGAPDVRLRNERDGLVSVELVGVDLYDPTTGSTAHGRGEDVAAVFVDQDYDGRTFCICQALFPARRMKDPWEKLQKALRGTIDESTFETLRGTRSLPFKPGKKIAVTVIDDRGNEVIKLVECTSG